MADLNRLIDEVLSMAKDSQNLRKKKQRDDESSAVNQSWDDTPAGQAYWKDIRARNSAMELEKESNRARLGEAQINNIGQFARQQLGGASMQTREPAGMGDAMFKSWYEKEGSMEGLTPEQLSEKRTMFQQYFGGNEAAPNEADAPTPEALRHELYSGMTDKDFRSAINNDPNLQGMGYVQNLRTGKTTRVINNDVFSGRTPSHRQQASTPKEPLMDSPPNIDRGIPPEVQKAQKGYEAKHSIWNRWLNALSSQADAEAGIVSPQSIPESPRTVFGRQQKMDLFKRKKKQEEEDIGAYDKWNKTRRF